MNPLQRQGEDAMLFLRDGDPIQADLPNDSQESHTLLALSLHMPFPRLPNTIGPSHQNHRQASSVVHGTFQKVRHEEISLPLGEQKGLNHGMPALGLVAKSDESHSRYLVQMLHKSGGLKFLQQMEQLDTYGT